MSSGGHLGLTACQRADRGDRRRPGVDPHAGPAGLAEHRPGRAGLWRVTAPHDGAPAAGLDRPADRLLWTDPAGGGLVAAGPLGARRPATTARQPVRDAGAVGGAVGDRGAAVQPRRVQLPGPGRDGPARLRRVPGRAGAARWPGGRRGTGRLAAHAHPVRAGVPDARGGRGVARGYQADPGDSRAAGDRGGGGRGHRAAAPPARPALRRRAGRGALARCAEPVGTTASRRRRAQRRGDARPPARRPHPELRRRRRHFAGDQPANRRVHQQPTERRANSGRPTGRPTAAG